MNHDTQPIADLMDKSIKSLTNTLTMKTQSQETTILNHLLKKGSITRMECIKKYEIINLPGRIFDLRKRNYPISDVMVTKNKKSFKKYFINEDYKPL